MTSLRKELSGFWRNEDGTGSWFSIVPLIFVLILLGLGLDINHAIEERTHLQVTADGAAHAAIVTRNQAGETAVSAKAAAVGIAALNMPPASDGNVLPLANIEFGHWNEATLTFTPDPTSSDAVRVITQRISSGNNPVATYLLKIAGFNSWDVRALTTMEAIYRDCHENGFIAHGIIDIQSNNVFKDGFCIISRTHVEVNQGNDFTDASIEMPNLEDFVMPASGYEQNEGLPEALGTGGYTIKEVEMLDTLIPNLATANFTYDPELMPETLDGVDSWVNVGSLKEITQGDIDSWATSHAGKVINVGCTGNNALKVKKDTLVHDVVMVTDCKLQFESGVVLSDSLIATSNTDPKSINGPSGIQIGDHDCTPGSDGGAQILTLGGAFLAAEVSFQSGQIIAKGDVKFQANSFSGSGASVLAGGEIDSNSNLTMEFCGNGGGSFREAYFVIVQ